MPSMEELEKEIRELRSTLGAVIRLNAKLLRQLAPDEGAVTFAASLESLHVHDAELRTVWDSAYRPTDGR